MDDQTIDPAGVRVGGPGLRRSEVRVEVHEDGSVGLFADSAHGDGWADITVTRAALERLLAASRRVLPDPSPPAPARSGTWVGWLGWW